MFRISNFPVTFDLLNISYIKSFIMKKLSLAFFPWLLLGFGYKAFAQDEYGKGDKRETEEIVIRKKGSKDANMNIEITGDKVLINGKPLVEFRDNEITINKRKIMVRDGNKLTFGDIDGDLGTGSFTWNKGNGKSVAFLGVSTIKTEDGAKITEEVAKETAAGKAGLQKGDIITRIDDEKIDGPQALYDAISAKQPKDEVKITYRHEGKKKTTKAILQEKRQGSYSKTYSYSGPDGSFRNFTVPAYPGLPEPPTPPAPPEFPDFAPEFQQELQGLQDEFRGFPRRQKLGLKIQDTEAGNAVKVLEVEDSSAAAIAGLKQGDLITEIAGSKITNTDEAREHFHENLHNSNYQVKALRNGTEMKFDVRIPKQLKTTNL